MSRKEVLAEGVSDRWVTIYALCEPIDKWKTGGVRYVGKTVMTPWQRVRSHSYAAKKPSPKLPVLRWLKKHIEASDPFHIIHLERIPPGQDWISREQFWIAKYRGDGARLLNITDGGEGLCGRNISGTDHAAKIASSLRKGAFFKCETCSLKFWRKPSAIKNGENRFCSRACYQRSLKGLSKPVHITCTEAGVAAAALEKLSRTHCKRGHGLSGDNLYRTSSGARGCRECRKIHKRSYRERCK